MMEECPSCGRETDHEVGVELRREAPEGVEERRRDYSKEPYRVAECQECGNREVERMNDGGPEPSEPSDSDS